MSMLSTVAAVAMAIGAPLVYADQAWSIQKKRNSEGFSKDVCAILLIANICRCFFWLGERFEFALLLQSILMIAAQLYLLSLLIKFRPGSFASSAYTSASSDAATTSASAAPSRPTSTLNDANSSNGPVFHLSVTPPPISPGSVEPNTNHNTGGGSNLGGLLGGQGRGGTRGRYAPLLQNLNFPPPPILGSEVDPNNDEEDNELSNHSLFRHLQPLIWLFKAGWQSGSGKRADGSSGLRPFGFWTWPQYSSYLIFLTLLFCTLGILHLIFGGFTTYIALLGFLALGLESTLPIPQAISNYHRKSLSGFRASVLVGWFGGDAFKTIYFIIQKSPLQFTVCALFQLSVDILIAAQMYLYRSQTAEDDEAQAMVQAEVMEAQERENGEIVDEGVQNNFSRGRGNADDHDAVGAEGSGDIAVAGENFGSTIFQIEADEEEEVGQERKKRGDGRK